MSAESEKKSIYAVIPAKLHRRLKVKAASCDTTLKEIVNVALREYLDRASNNGDPRSVETLDNNDGKGGDQSADDVIAANEG